MTYEEFSKRYSYNPNLDKIGNGRYAAFYSAYDNVLHRDVTIKKVVTEVKPYYTEAYISSNFVYQVNLKDEIEVLRSIPRHRNVAYYNELYSFEGYDYAILPYHVESDLCDLMQQHLSMTQKESIALQLLDSLDFLHKNHIQGWFDSWNILIITTQDGYTPIITNLGVKPQVVNMSVEAYGDPLFFNHNIGNDFEMYGIVLYELFSGRLLHEDIAEPYWKHCRIDDYCPQAEVEAFQNIVRQTIVNIPVPWRQVIEKCLLSNNNQPYTIDTNAAIETWMLYNIVNNNISSKSNVINGYTLLYQLGEGGMAEVWYAENKIGKKAAVKILSPKFCGDKIIVARFENEAHVMVRLEHPNIRQVYDYATLDGHPCIIMEYLEGNDLNRMMKRGHLFSDNELVKWWNQMVQALNYTHKMGVVHRDIKPSNIFIDNHGNVKLLDFGIAKNSDNAANTYTNSIMGTLLYMSPEQVKDPKRVTYKTDLYSLAVTFVHLLTGKTPYDSTKKSNFDIQMKIVKEPLDTSELTPTWRDFLEPYLDKNPNNRPELTVFDGSINPNTHPYQYTTSDESTSTVFSDLETKSGNQYRIEKDGDDLVITINGISFVMKKVEGGLLKTYHPIVFGDNEYNWMSAFQEQEYDESRNGKPISTVKVNNYYIGETPVTQALWNALMTKNPSEHIGDDLPVDFGHFEDGNATDFLSKLRDITGLHFRLPSELEWEYASRGGNQSKGYKYSGSNVLNHVAWFYDNSGGTTHPVKQKIPNELGIYDMCGNVLEPCEGAVSKGGCYAFEKKDCQIASREDGCDTTCACWHGLRLSMSDNEELEMALNDYRQKAERIIVLSECCDLIQIAEEREKSLADKPRPITYPAVIALALMVDEIVGPESKVAIVVHRDDFMEIAIVMFGDGICEICHTAFTSHMDKQSVYKILSNARAEEGIVDQIVLVTESQQNIECQRWIEQVFGMNVEVLNNFHQLIKRGSDIQNGILSGSVKDVLLLQVVSQVIGIEQEDGLMLPLTKKDTSIPAKQSKEILYNANTSKFVVDIWQGNDKVAKNNVKIATLEMKNHCIENTEKRSITITIDIDCNYLCTIIMEDKKYQERIEYIIKGKHNITDINKRTNCKPQPLGNSCPYCGENIVEITYEMFPYQYYNNNIPWDGKCKNCKHDFIIDHEIVKYYPTLPCPHCGKQMTSNSTKKWTGICENCGHNFSIDYNIAKKVLDKWHNPGPIDYF